MNSERLIDIIEDAGYEPRSYSDHRSVHNQLADLRRLLGDPIIADPREPRDWRT